MSSRPTDVKEHRQHHTNQSARPEDTTHVCEVYLRYIFYPQRARKAQEIIINENPSGKYTLRHLAEDGLNPKTAPILA